MALFNFNKKRHKDPITTGEMRPCWVRGRRAFFHRWTDSARPVVPHGMTQEETNERYQVWSVHALVEFEDGKVERVWPYEVQFADGGSFDEYSWEQMEHNRDELAGEEPAVYIEVIDPTKAAETETD